MTQTCRACRHSGMEPDGPARLICGYKPGYGVYIDTPRGNETPAKGCGIKRPAFEQHPGRTKTGNLRKTST